MKKLQKQETKTSKSRGRTVLLAGLAFLLLITFVLVYDVFWKKPVQVNRGMAQLDNVYTGHTRELWAVRFSPDGMLVASGGVDSAVHVWKRDNAKVVHLLKQPTGVTTLEFSPDGRYIIIGGYDGMLRLWDLSAENLIREWKGHAGTIWMVQFSSNGKTLASSGEDRVVKLWNVEKGSLLQSIQGHQMNIWKVRFTPDGRKVISSSFDNTIKIWDVANGTLLKTLEGHKQAVVGLAVSPNGQTIASGSDDKTIKLWDAQSGKLLRTLPGGDEHVYAVAFSPDGKMLISSNRDRGAVGELIQNFLGNVHMYKGVTMRLWEVETGRLLQTFAQHDNDVMDVAFSPDGRWFASASDDHTVQLWRLVK